MKNFLFILGFIFIYSFGNAQGVPAKANTIVITLPDSNNVNEKILKLLTSKDYPIQSDGKGSSSIITGPKTLKNNSRVSLTAKVKGAEVLLTGRVVVAAQGNIPIEYKGNKGSPIMNGWEEMDKIAKALGGKITYEIK